MGQLMILNVVKKSLLSQILPKSRWTSGRRRIGTEFMKNFFKLTLLVFLFFLLTGFPVSALEAGASAIVQNPTQDTRIAKLHGFLEFYNSPLTDYASVFIKAADKYGIDWKLVPAIAGVESTFGKAIPYNSYNAYGWAGGEYYFASWEDSVEIVSRALRANYYNRGLDSVAKISPVYCPPNKNWGIKVQYFMDKLENFSPKSTLALELSL